jgi:hypothetical protein
MLSSILRLLFPHATGEFEGYYQSILERSGETTAPSVHEARRDYVRSLRTRINY